MYVCMYVCMYMYVVVIDCIAIHQNIIITTTTTTTTIIIIIIIIIGTSYCKQPPVMLF